MAQRTGAAGGLCGRPAAALLSLLLAAAALLPLAYSLPQHSDESQYGWSAAYYGRRLARLDFSPTGTDAFLDPGWSPASWWALTQPMGTRAVYALALGISGAATPSIPFSQYQEVASQGTAWLLPGPTLLLLRLVAVACAAAGFALISLRLGWRGLLVTVLMLAIPHVRGDLARAWAEGPLLLGLALCVLAYGSRWFLLACGLAPAFKLTALLTWPVAYRAAPVGRSRFAHVAAVGIASLVWSALTPPSWFAGGPLYLFMMLADRSKEYREQTVSIGGPFGLFFVSRYLLPLELAAALFAVLALPRMVRGIWRRLAAGRRRPAAETAEA